jgi:hypothetical protein
MKLPHVTTRTHARTHARTHIHPPTHTHTNGVHTHADSHTQLTTRPAVGCSGDESGPQGQTSSLRPPATPHTKHEQQQLGSDSECTRWHDAGRERGVACCPPHLVWWWVNSRHAPTCNARHSRLAQAEITMVALDHCWFGKDGVGSLSTQKLAGCLRTVHAVRV